MTNAQWGVIVPGSRTRRNCPRDERNNKRVKHSKTRRLLSIALLGSVAFGALTPLPSSAVNCAPGSETVGNDVILSFTGTGTCAWTVPDGVSSAQVVVVGGGGGGGFGNVGGGGGAGQVLMTNDASPVSLTPGTSLSITVGEGGSSGAGDATNASSSGSWSAGGNGGASSLSNIATASGGGGGGGNTRLTGANGGSGGGGAAVSNSSGGSASSSAPAGWSSFANSGADGKYGEKGGGGGGAGGPGNQLSNGTLFYGKGGYFKEIWGKKLAAGGSGWSTVTGAENQADGGELGGNSRTSNPYQIYGQTKGTDSTGSGGGAGGSGGSGVVLVRYATPYNLTLNANGGSGGTSSLAVANGSTPSFSAPNRDSYTLLGWAAGANDNIVDYPANLTGFSMPASDTTLYAVWTANTYSLTYAAGSDANGSNQTATKTDGVDLALADKATADGWFTRSGYKVIGWSTTDGGAVDYSFGSSYTVDADESLYPVWGCYANSLVTSGLIVHLDAFNACSTGTEGVWRDLSGNGRDLIWQGANPTLQDSNGKYYPIESPTYGEFSADGLSDLSNGFSATFYANLGSAGSYERVFDIGNGSADDNVVLARYQSTDKFLFQILNGSTQVVRCQSGDMIDGNWNFYALTVATDGTCTFYKNGSEVTSPDPEAKNALTGAPVGERTNRYLGKSNWSDPLMEGAIGDFALYSKELSSSEISTNFAAQSPAAYTITYNYNGADGGTRPSEGIFTLGSGVDLTLPSPTKSTFLFGGWYSDSGLTNFVGYADDTYTPSATGNLFARWTNLLINLDGSNSDSLANAGNTWTSVLPGASKAVGEALGDAAYFIDGAIEGFEFDNNADAIKFPVNTGNIDGQLTLEMWIQPSSLRDGWNIIASKWFDDLGDGSTGTFQWHLAIKKEGALPLRLNAYTSSNGTSHALANAYGDFEFASTDTKWYLLGFTIDSSNNLQFYVNGVADGDPHAGAVHTPRASQLWIGDARESVGFNGKVSEFRLYNKALSSSQMFSSFKSAAATYGLSSIEFKAGAQGSGSDVTNFKNDDVNITLPDSATANSYFTRNGFDVTGWSLNADGSTTDFALGATYTANSDTTPSLVLYPVWTAKTYTLTYAAGADGTGSNQTATKTHDVDLALANLATGSGWFIRSGHKLTGWSVNPDGSTTDYALGGAFALNEDETLYPVWETTSIEASGDAYVQSGASGNSNFGSSSILLFKNAADSTSNSYNRVAYAEFEYNPGFDWSGAALEIYVTGNADGSRNNGYNNAYTSFNVDIYGASDASWDEETITFNIANGSGQGWGINTGTWPWNPNSATYLGTISIPTSSSTVGQKFALATEALDTFLNGDADGNVTIYMRRSDVDPQANLSFASRDNSTYPGPSLVVAGGGYTYTIAYDINGGTGSVPAPGTFTQGGSDYTVLAGSNITPPANKTFMGWNTKADGSGTDVSAGSTYNTARSVTLYAKYVMFPKAVFKSNYTGGPADVTQNISPSTNANLRLNSFSRTGYTFERWDTISGGTETAYTDGQQVNITSDLTLFAQWTANTYTVNFNYNGATLGDDDSSDTFTTGGAAINLPTPSRTGYTFGGWYVSDVFSGSALGATYSPTANTTIHAKWNPVAYTITYASTNGSGSAPQDLATYNYQQSATIKANTALTRTGWEFAGWVLDPTDVNETPRNAGDTIQFGAAKITLEPKWTAKTYTVTYNLNGATGGSLPRTSETFTTGDGNLDLPDVGTMVKLGHTFGGWSDTPTGAAVADSLSTTENLTLYAVWTIKPISYSYAKGLAGGQDPGVTVPGSSTGNFGTTVTLGVPSAVNLDLDGSLGTDHVFFGWSDGTNTYQPGDQYRLGETAPTFTALWAKVYQVRYAFAGGTPAGSDNEFDSECVGTDNTCSSPLTINAHGAPERAGYNFLGWEDQSGATISAGASFTVDDDSYLLFAKWQPIEYNFSFNSNQGSETNASFKRTIGQVFQLPSAGTKDGYNFAGWSDGTRTYQVGGNYVVGTASAGFNAVWTAKTSTITYDWQGGKAKGATLTSATYTFSDSAMTLPDGSSYERDGYEFSGWSTSPSGSLVTNLKPTADDILYAVWADGDYTLSYDGKGAQSGSGFGTVARDGSVTLPTPVRAGFVFNGWYDSETGGNKVGNGGDVHAPGRSKTMYARWIQKSLYGVDEADLETAATLSVGSDGSGGSFTKNSAGATSASVVVPDGALPENTVVSARYFKDLQRQAALIEGDNNYIFSLLVSWLTGSGDSATVPDTDPTKPIEVTLTSSAIKAGQMIYQVIGDEVTELGRADADGTITVELFTDPEIVVVATVPNSPTNVTATSATGSADVNWTAPASDGGSPILGYTVTANPGGETCTTVTTSCTISGLTDGIAYTFSVTAENSVGDSGPSSSSTPVTPAALSYTVTYNSNGGSAVSSGTFVAGATISAPTTPSRSGYTFEGWSTTLNDASTKATFPYQAADLNLTFYALWTQVQSSSSGGTNPPVVAPDPTPGPTPNPGPTPSPTPSPVAPPSQIGFVPTPPSTPVAETGPVGGVAGSAERVIVTSDAPRENLVAKGSGWEIKVRVENVSGDTSPVQTNLSLQAQMSGTAALSGIGLRPNTVVEVWAFSDKTYIGTVSVGANGAFESELDLPDSLLPGEHTLQIGTLNTAGQLITLSIPITVKGKVTVGTFKGYIAIYTADIFGQRLSAKVAGKWVVQNPISEFKRYSYSRLVRFTGAGYDIIVDVYINRKFYERTTTRTR